MAGQVVNYLTGEPLDWANEFAVAIQSDLPEIADNLMRQDRNLRETIVYTLRMRIILTTHTTPEFIVSPESEPIRNVLHTYAQEFPEEVDERRYAALVDRLRTWAESPGFPGRNF